MLVVVLIIGVLVATALPQYERSVLRSRYTQVQTLATSIYQAQVRYFLANGIYSNDFNALDINVPVTKDTEYITPSGKIYGAHINDVACFLGSSALGSSDSDFGHYYVWCINRKYEIGYRIIPITGKTYCTSWTTDKEGGDFCHSLTGSEKENWTKKHPSWPF